MIVLHISEVVRLLHENLALKPSVKETLNPEASQQRSKAETEASFRLHQPGTPPAPEVGERGGGVGGAWFWCTPLWALSDTRTGKGLREYYKQFPDT